MMDTISENAMTMVAQLGTRDVFEIARSNGVNIMYGSWHPITIGEFDRGTKTIRVNKRAVADATGGAALEIKIIAHELGHFFAGSMKMDNEEEESFSRAFATALVGD
jgi:hypothetical protein